MPGLVLPGQPIIKSCRAGADAKRSTFLVFIRQARGACEAPRNIAVVVPRDNPVPSIRMR